MASTPPHTPTVSVLMSVHNAPTYLETAIESVLRQSYSDFEFIVIDDGSTDNTLARCESFGARDSRIRVVPRAHEGLTKSLNHGLSLANGELVARMDADDVSHPERLASQVRFLRDNPHLVAAGCNVDVIDYSGQSVAIWETAEEHETIMWQLIFGNVIAHPCCIFRTDSVREIGGYDCTIPYAQDYDLWVRLVMTGSRLGNIPLQLFSYRQHVAQISARKSIEQNSIASHIAQRYTEWLIEEPVDLDALDNLRTMFKRLPNRINPTHWAETQELLFRINRSLIPRISESEHKRFVSTARKRLKYCAKRLALTHPLIASAMIWQAVGSDFNSRP